MHFFPLLVETGWVVASIASQSPAAHRAITKNMSSITMMKATELSRCDDMISMMHLDVHGKGHVCDHELHESIFRAYSASKYKTDGSTFVVYSPRWTGKTKSALMLLDRVATKNPGCGRGKYFDLSLDTSDVQNGLAASLGVGHDSDTRLWLPRFFLALNGMEYVPGTSKTMAQKLKALAIGARQGMSKLFGSATEPADVSFENKVGHFPPVVVIDGLDNSISQAGLQFIENFAKKSKQRRILTLVLTGSREAATDLCQKSAIMPLPNSYIEGLKMTDTRYWKGFPWTRKNLTTLVTRYEETKQYQYSQDLFNDMGHLNFLDDGMTPNEAINAAIDIMRGGYLGNPLHKDSSKRTCVPFLPTESYTTTGTSNESEATDPNVVATDDEIAALPPPKVSSPKSASSSQKAESGGYEVKWVKMARPTVPGEPTTGSPTQVQCPPASGSPK